MDNETKEQAAGNQARAGDLAALVGSGYKNFLLLLEPGHALHTHRGIIEHNNLIGIPYGSEVFSHTGAPYYLLKPTLADLLLKIKRNTQIMYPKDIGFVLVKMGIGPCKQVLEAGTGSGGLTTALAYAVGKQGRVYSYDNRAEMQNLAQKNLMQFGMEEQVTFKLRDISEGFDEQGLDAVFLDVQTPDEYIPQVRAALRPGSPFGSLLPTTNQVSRLVRALEANDFAFIEVCEILLRYYKPVPDRLRPSDRMVAHTGFLIFARPMLPAVSPPPRFPAEEGDGGDMPESNEDEIE